MERRLLILSFLLIFENVSPSLGESSFVVSSKKTRNVRAFGTFPEVFEMDIMSNVSNRFATTLVRTKVRNLGYYAKETTFTVVLPENAFISEFIMEVGDKRFRAQVEGKEEAKKIYDRAVERGQTAAHVSARDSNKFAISLNVEPRVRVTFLLTYEELLQRKNEQYELILNIHPGQVVQQLHVEVNIKGNKPLRFVKTPSIRSGNEISKNEAILDPSANIKWLNKKSAVVTFHPNSEKQKKFARGLKTRPSEGLSGQFVVQYDVERDCNGGEVLLQDGYFVHFFAPADLEPLPKHVLFVLDTSGSMYGRKINQLKDAMKSILKQIKKGDKISIIEFNTMVKVWNINSRSARYIPNYLNYGEPFYTLSRQYVPLPNEFNRLLLRKANKVVNAFQARGATNIIGALEIALYLVKIDQERRYSDKKHQPIIIFLTDGEPNVVLSSTDEIVNVVTRLNSQNNNVPIYSLSFGESANKEFLRKLSLKNHGFSKHIYAANDASLQLQDFYKQISFPLLSKIYFKYESQFKNVTIKDFPIYFQGSELVVAGKYGDLYIPPTVKCVGPTGSLTLNPVVLGSPVTQLERLWAYLTVKQILDKRASADDKTELTNKAVEMAKKYTFVTDVTSLVVVKPNGNSVVELEDAFDETLLITPRGSFDFGTESDELETKPETDDGLETNAHTIPWLASVLGANETMTIGKNVYELGSNYTVVNETTCLKTPVNSTEPGYCLLLKDCPEVYPNLKNFQTYQDYFCVVDNKYAGICCPDE